MLTSPPYDVISKEDLQRLRNCKYNITWLTMPEEGKDKYLKAADNFSRWFNDGIFSKENEDSIYIYEQQFVANGRIYERTGIISLVKIEDYAKKAILPHEQTLSNPKEDRLGLLRAAETDFGITFSIYKGSNDVLSQILTEEKQKQPAEEFRSLDGILNKLWVIKSKSKISAISDYFKNKTLFIADGHHRYEAALNYKKEMAAKNPDSIGEELWNYKLMCLIADNDEGLIILPTHRLIYGLPQDRFDNFFERLKKNFDVQENQDREILPSVLKKHVIGMYYEDKSYLLFPTFEINTEDPVEDLDVRILHEKIIHNVLGITPAKQEKGGNIEYIKGTEEKTLSMMQDIKKYQVGFFLYPNSVKELENVAEAGMKMPQKTTFFYPKVITGLVFNSFNRSTY